MIKVFIVTVKIAPYGRIIQVKHKITSRFKLKHFPPVDNGTCQTGRMIAGCRRVVVPACFPCSSHIGVGHIFDIFCRSRAYFKDFAVIGIDSRKRRIDKLLVRHAVEQRLQRLMGRRIDIHFSILFHDIITAQFQLIQNIGVSLLIGCAACFFQLRIPFDVSGFFQVQCLEWGCTMNQP